MNPTVVDVRSTVVRVRLTGVKKILTVVDVALTQVRLSLSTVRPGPEAARPIRTWGTLPSQRGGIHPALVAGPGPSPRASPTRVLAHQTAVREAVTVELKLRRTAISPRESPTPVGVHA